MQQSQEKPAGTDTAAVEFVDVVGTPEPPAPYRTQQVFPKLKFNEPLAMTWVPGRTGC